VLLRDVFDDAEEVASVDSVRERACEVSALEGGDAVDDGIEGIASDGTADAAVGIEEVKPCECVVEDATDEGVLACSECLAGFVDKTNNRAFVVEGDVRPRVGKGEMTEKRLSRTQQQGAWLWLSSGLRWCGLTGVSPRV
jgi:hypothetical protein